MIDEKTFVERVEQFLKSVAKKHNATGIVISKDGYFFYYGDGDQDFVYYPNTKSIVDRHTDIFDSMLSPVERLFSDAICAAVEDVRKAYFQKYPSALLYLNGRGIMVSKKGDWSDSDAKETLFEIVREVL